MVKQLHEYSCGAACARQLLLDDAIDVPESQICDEAGFVPTEGIYAKLLADALTKLHGRPYHGGVADPPDPGGLQRHTPFLAMLVRHWVIVDEIEQAGVCIRDPSPSSPDSEFGSEAELSITEFNDLWVRGRFQVVIRVRGE